MALTLEKAVLEKMESLQNIMLASVTGGTRDEAEYRRIREELFSVPELKEVLPRFVRTCGDLSQLWHFIKTQENLGSMRAAASSSGMLFGRSWWEWRMRLVSNARFSSLRGRTTTPTFI